jgi:hypothetical protein
LTKINAHMETVSLHSLESERLQYKPPHVFGAGESLKGTAADIVAILTEGEDEEDAPRAG